MNNNDEEEDLEGKEKNREEDLEGGGRFGGGV